MAGRTTYVFLGNLKESEDAVLARLHDGDGAVYHEDGEPAPPAGATVVDAHAYRSLCRRGFVSGHEVPSGRLFATEAGARAWRRREGRRP